LSILLCIVWSVTGRALPARLAILALAVAIDRGSSFVQYTYAYAILLICGHYPYAIRHTLMSSAHPRDPLHGITLEAIITELVEQYGWVELTSSPARGTGCTIIRPEHPHASSITERPAS
jgi:hypothetical protein